MQESKWRHSIKLVYFKSFHYFIIQYIRFQKLIIFYIKCVIFGTPICIVETCKQHYFKNEFYLLLTKFLKGCSCETINCPDLGKSVIWRPPSLSELTPIISNIGSETSLYLKNRGTELVINNKHWLFNKRKQVRLTRDID